MASDPERSTDELALRVLTCEDLDERIHRLAVWIAAGTDDPAAGEPGPEERLDPRWITPAELVRRVRPYLVYN
jgi:hypothetical protein